MRNAATAVADKPLPADERFQLESDCVCRRVYQAFRWLFKMNTFKQMLFL